MKTMEWRFVDKSTWDRGPWDEEPDKMQWRDKATGLPCLVHRGSGGFLCGYVGILAAHPSFKKDYGAVDADVHGGLTYSALCGEVDEQNGEGICHIAPGEADVWWLGFDCGHSGDRSPGSDARSRDFYATHPEYAQLRMSGTYRTLAYAKRECAKLAKQLAATA